MEFTDEQKAFIQLAVDKAKAEGLEQGKKDVDNAAANARKTAEADGTKRAESAREEARKELLEKLGIDGENEEKKLSAHALLKARVQAQDEMLTSLKTSLETERIERLKALELQALTSANIPADRVDSVQKLFTLEKSANPDLTLETFLQTNAWLVPESPKSVIPGGNGSGLRTIATDKSRKEMTDVLRQTNPYRL